MPALEKITIAPADMLNILEALRQLNHNHQVIIIDTINSYTVRDTDDQFLTEVKKEEQPVSG